METEALPPVRNEPLWRRILPFVVAFALIAFVLSRLDFSTFIEALHRVNHLALATFAITFVFALLITDAFATREVYRRTIGEVKFRDLFVMRAASYLPSILNHHLGQAWLTYFLSRVYGAPLWRVAGATLLVYITVFAGLIVISGAALPFKAVAVPWLVPVVSTLALLGVVYLLVLRSRPRFLLRRQITAPLVEVGVAGHLMLVLYRVPHLVVLFFGNWIPFELFGVHIPWGDALMLMPVILLVSALPITPQGVGTRDALALQLFASFAPGSPSERAAALAASTLSFAISATLVQLVVSPLYMARAQRLLAAAAGTGSES